MAPSPKERKEFGRRLRLLRGERTLQQVVDHLRDEYDFRTNTAQLSGWERGEYAPKHRSLVGQLDSYMLAGGDLLAALGMEPVRGQQGHLRLVYSDQPFEMQIPVGEETTEAAYVQNEILAFLETMAARGTGWATWVGDGDAPEWLAPGLARFAGVTQEQFAQAAEGGATESQTGTVEKPPATGGFDPDED